MKNYKFAYVITGEFWIEASNEDEARWHADDLARDYVELDNLEVELVGTADGDK